MARISLLRVCWLVYSKRVQGLFCCLLLLVYLWMFYKNNTTRRFQISEYYQQYAEPALDAEHMTMPRPTVPPSLRKFVPRAVDFIDGYWQVPFADLYGIGDVGQSYKVPHNISDAAHKCNGMNVTCRAFLFGLNASAAGTTAVIKYSFGIPTHSASTHLYIKREHVNLFIKGLTENLMCAIPFKRFMGSTASQGCKLPKLDPFYKEIVHLTQRKQPVKCDRSFLFTILENNTLKIREGMNLDKLDFIVAQPILRAKDSDFHHTLGPKKYLNALNKSFPVQDDLWVVTTFMKDKKRRENYHMSIIEKPEVLQRRSTHSKSPLDIMIVMFDGTSTAHFERMLPQTYKFLTEDLEALMVKGYSVVGDATTPNLSAMLTGNTIEENAKIQEARRGKKGSGTVDKWPFIFKDFKKHGFGTFWSEDYEMIGAFTLRMNGFKEQPTDHYGRPLWQRAGGYCIGEKPQTTVQLDYLKSFMKSYPDRRKFGKTFLCELTHQTLNFISVADEEIVTWLRSIQSDNLLNTTMLVMMADHGARFGEIRDTNQGRLEERLPLLSVVLPQWFKKKFPEEMENFRRNSEIISSPFDLHATLLHLLEFSKKGAKQHKSPHGLSFFTPFPANRTCGEAGISDEWCPCLAWREINITHAHIKKGAQAAVRYLNDMLARHDISAKLCLTIRLKRIISAVQKMTHLVQGSKHQEDECTYQVQFETIPGDARFEAIIRMIFSGEAIVYGTVSRINKYGSQSACITDKLPALRKYCYCK